MNTEESKILDKALDAAKDYADAVVKGSLSEFGGILSDAVGFWRLRNRVKLMLKTKRWLEDKGVNPTKVLPEVFVPLLEDGGNVTDEGLSDMFSSLLATHLDPEQQDNVHPSYTKVLSQLSPLDAQAMLIFRKFISYKGARDVGLRGGGVTVDYIAEELKVTINAAYLSCLNLNRLGIVEHNGYYAPKKHPLPKLFKESPESQRFRITEYGIAFCTACQYKEQ